MAQERSGENGSRSSNLKDRPKKRGGVVFLTMAIGNGVSFTVKNCLSESDEK